MKMKNSGQIIIPININSDTEISTEISTSNNIKYIKKQKKQRLRKTSEYSMIPALDEMDDVIVKVFKNETFWHIAISVEWGDYILEKFQTNTGLKIAFSLMPLYMFGLFTFDRCLLGDFAIIYSMIINIPCFIMCLIYFGTFNCMLFKRIISDFEFWFKMSSILISNIMTVIWANNNVPFNDDTFLHSKQLWFIIYGMYFITNIVCSSMGCLLDAYNWNRCLKIGGPI